MFKSQILFLAMGKCLCCTHGILDLPSIDLLADKCFPFLGRKCIGGSDLGEEGFPNSRPRLLVEITIAKGNVNATLEGVIEGGHTVGRQKEDTSEVFELTQKHSNKGVSVDVMDRALLEENVRFVNEDDGVPGVGNVENFVERAIQRGSRSSKVSCSNDIERLSEICK